MRQNLHLLIMQNICIPLNTFTKNYDPRGPNSKFGQNKQIMSACIQSYKRTNSQRNVN